MFNDSHDYRQQHTPQERSAVSAFLADHGGAAQISGADSHHTRVLPSNRGEAICNSNSVDGHCVVGPMMLRGNS